MNVLVVAAGLRLRPVDVAASDDGEGGDGGLVACGDECREELVPHVQVGANDVLRVVVVGPGAVV